MKTIFGPEAMSAISRREFLKTASGSAGGALAGTLALERSVFAAPENQIKLALVGCGGRGTGAANQALNTGPDIRVVAMADVMANRVDSSLRSLAAIHPKAVDVPVERQFIGFDGYKHAISHADVVILASPPGFRPAHFEEAVRQGKHVFMEKPVATDAPGVRKVLAAAAEAKRKGLKVGVGLQRRHQPGYIEAVKRLQEGAVGDILSMRCYWNGTSREGLERMPGETEMHYQVRNWYYFTWLSGDHNVEQHIHNIDVINWIKGTHPIRAQGMGGRQVRNQKIHGQIFDHHFVEYEYEDGSRLYSQCRQIRQCWTHIGEHVQGSRGEGDLSDSGRYRITGPNAWQLRLKQRENGHQLEHYPLFDAIRKNEAFNEAEIGAISTMTAIMGRMATYSGAMIEWDEALNSTVQLVPDDIEDWNSTPPVLPDAEGWYPIARPGSTIVA